jgi:hypothetical protein
MLGIFNFSNFQIDLANFYIQLKFLVSVVSSFIEQDLGGHQLIDDALFHFSLDKFSLVYKLSLQVKTYGTREALPVKKINLDVRIFLLIHLYMLG